MSPASAPGAPAAVPASSSTSTATRAGFEGVPCLASVRRGTGDGVSYASALIERALRDLYGATVPTVDLRPQGRPGVAMLERARFATRIATVGARRDAGWVFYSHLGIARTQRSLPRPLRLPYAIFLHGVEVWNESLDRARVETMRDARLLLSNSRFTARRVSAAHPAVGEIAAVPLALLPRPIAARGARDAQSRGPDAPYALVVGRMSAAERYKGHDELLEAWAGVRERCGKARLVVAGDGDDRQRLEAKAIALGHGDAVTFVGRASDAELEALFESASLFVMPSRGEGFGLVYLEAMRAGVACVGATDDAAGEVIEDGVTGLLVPQRDRAALASAVGSLLAEPVRAHAMGAAGRRRFEQRFTYESFRNRLAAALGQAGARVAAESA